MRQVNYDEIKGLPRGIVGYKVFDEYGNTPHGIFTQNLENTYWIEDKRISMCESGFHYCKNLFDCFRYVPINNRVKIMRVIGYGANEVDSEKIVTQALYIDKEIHWESIYNSNIQYSDDCKHSKNVYKSNDVYGGIEISSSDNIKHSSSINYSVDVENSTLVYRSSNIEDSYDIYNSSKIINSENISESCCIDNCDLIDFSYHCENSSKIRYSNQIYDSAYIEYSDNIFLSTYLKHCSHMICCCEQNYTEYCFFNQPISENRFISLMTMIKDNIIDVYTCPEYDSKIFYICLEALSTGIELKDGSQVILNKFDCRNYYDTINKFFYKDKWYEFKK